MQHIPYEHVERLARGRHADLIAAGRDHRRATAASDTNDTRAAHPRSRTSVRVVAAGAVTAAIFTAWAAYAFVETPRTPESPEPADSLVVDRFLRAV